MLRTQVNITSLNVGLTIDGLKENGYDFLTSDAPATKIPELSLSADQQSTILHLSDGTPSFRSHHNKKVYEYRFDDQEPPKNILWMALPIIERLHQQKERFTVHSSSFAKQDKGVLVVGETHAGKTTTLLSAMLEREYEGIAGEHTLITADSLVGGTKIIEFYSGTASFISKLKKCIEPHPLGWEKTHRLKMPMSSIGPTTPGAKLRLVVFPMITADREAQLIFWTKRKQSIELYKKMSELILAFNSFLFNNSCGFPSLDTMELSRKRMETATHIVNNCSFLVVKGNKDSILDVIDKELDGI